MSSVCFVGFLTWFVWEKGEDEIDYAVGGIVAILDFYFMCTICSWAGEGEELKAKAVRETEKQLSQERKLATLE